MGTVPLFSGIREEIKQVTWPTRKEATELTLTVITISLIVALFVGIIDFSLAHVLGLIK
ncbi:preprotein translocase subunit SecE [Candidatus Roizmanbacteria bacterium RIFCSPHIGHO2_02_FULL_40_9]|uniref:Protein translocase subunit SecE n=2 Tax=Candidatus Roizmaniibacteriota TaxID=1752723 RepID=A0A1F7IM05_9BACT|nr:MAG: preprotein translocase subunit SecE [Candidatus Roizmanbacteria bacterium RIFCSPHIGHO2_02_FULL_40_9]OGK44375.1 MAG: preprotein translocase subunit SecE [Candidatus Roizmanbacteria bacterium RIFCSPLOWO2_01_FULL_38_11]